jgi:hypothetical protein
MPSSGALANSTLRPFAFPAPKRSRSKARASPFPFGIGKRLHDRADERGIVLADVDFKPNHTAPFETTTARCTLTMWPHVATCRP